MEVDLRVAAAVAEELGYLSKHFAPAGIQEGPVVCQQFLDLREGAGLSRCGDFDVFGHKQFLKPHGQKQAVGTVYLHMKHGPLPLCLAF